jgi:hypothetical protein
MDKPIPTMRTTTTTTTTKSTTTTTRRTTTTTRRTTTTTRTRRTTPTTTRRTTTTTKQPLPVQIITRPPQIFTIPTTDKSTTISSFQKPGQKDPRHGGCGLPAKSGSCPKGRIVNGTQSCYGQFPWQVIE